MSSGADNGLLSTVLPAVHTARVSGHRWLTAQTFEIRFQRPTGFDFLPGQKVQLVHEGIRRDYTLLTAPDDDELALCVRHIPQGRLSPVLASAQIGRTFLLTPAFGFFQFQTSSRPAVFAATGTGIAPFVSFARSGVKDFQLLHGVRRPEELYYQDILVPAAAAFIPCLTGVGPPVPHWPQAFAGRVTAYLGNQLPAGDYDFYLCGNGAMVRDTMRIIDRRFPASKVFTETFF